jgi:hypothetical protein
MFQGGEGQRGRRGEPSAFLSPRSPATPPPPLWQVDFEHNTWMSYRSRTRCSSPRKWLQVNFWGLDAFVARFT